MGWGMPCRGTSLDPLRDLQAAMVRLQIGEIAPLPRWYRPWFGFRSP
jgi:hypothetical protein